MTRFDVWSRMVARSSKPILVGPWTSELGFEALYWLPWLMWWRERYGIDKQRLVAVGRGGSAVWYDMAGTADVYDHASVKDVRLQTMLRQQGTGSVKQQGITAWDEAMLKLIASTLNIGDYWTLHPSAMYQMLQPYWAGKQPMAFLHERTRYTRLGVPVLPPGMELPERFIAARVYARPTLPPHEDTLIIVNRWMLKLSEKIPVILLHNGECHDDHVDMLKAVDGRIHVLPKLPPHENLAILSAVLGRAEKFIGTYGGMQQLALRMGVPSIGLYSEWGGTAMAHLTLSQALGVVSETPFMVMRPGDIERWGLA